MMLLPIKRNRVPLPVHEDDGGGHSIPQIVAPDTRDTDASRLRFPLPPTKIDDGRLFRKIG
jgi:hypothetical protein